MLIGNNDELATHKKKLKKQKTHWCVKNKEKIRKNKEQSFRVRNKK